MYDYFHDIVSAGSSESSSSYDLTARLPTLWHFLITVAIELVSLSTTLALHGIL